MGEKMFYSREYLGSESNVNLTSFTIIIETCYVGAFGVLKQKKKKAEARLYHKEAP